MIANNTPFGIRVRTASVLERRDFGAAVIRRPSVSGVIVAKSDSHGLCFQVRHEDGAAGWYDPDELTEVGEVSPRTRYARLLEEDL